MLMKMREEAEEVWQDWQYHEVGVCTRPSYWSGNQHSQVLESTAAIELLISGNLKELKSRSSITSFYNSVSGVLG